jgi:MFS family permease
VGQLTREEQERGMRNVLRASVAGTAFYFTVYGGSAVTLFAKKLGAEEGVVGLLAAILQVAVLLQVPLVREVEARGKKRLLVPAFALLGLCSLPLVFLPYLPESPGLRQQVLVAAFVLIAVVQQLVSVSWTPLQGDVIPDDVRGRYQGRLQTAWQSSALVVTVAVVALLGYKAEWWQFQVVFLIGVLACFARLPFIRRIPEVPPQPGAKVRSRFSFIAEALRDRSFMLFILLVATINGALVMMGPFSITYMKRVLLYGDKFITFATQGLPLVGAILTLILWGHLSDRIGNRAIFVFTTAATAVLMLVWLAVRPGHLFDQVVLAASIFLRGLVQAGFGIAVARFFFGALPPGNRSGYSAAYTVIIGLTGVSPLLAGSILDHTMGVTYRVAGLALDNYQMLFAVSAAASVVPLVILRWMKTPGDAPAREFLNFLLARPFRTTMDLVQYHRPLDEEERAAITRRLAGAPSAVTMRELLAGLDDPSYEVREAAVRGLAAYRHPEVIHALRARLDPANQDSLILPTVTWALGELEAAETVQDLIGALAHPDRHVRAQAALALAKIGQLAAAEPLRRLWDAEQDPYVLACVATALSRLRDGSFVPGALRRLTPDTPVVARLQLATAIGAILPLDEDFYELLRSERKRRGSAVKGLLSAAMRDSRLAMPPGRSGARTSVSALWRAYLRGENALVVGLVAESLRRCGIGSGESTGASASAQAAWGLSGLAEPIGVDIGLLACFALPADGGAQRPTVTDEEAMLYLCAFRALAATGLPA